MSSTPEGAASPSWDERQAWHELIDGVFDPDNPWPERPLRLIIERCGQRVSVSPVRPEVVIPTSCLYNDAMIHDSELRELVADTVDCDKK